MTSPYLKSIPIILENYRTNPWKLKFPDCRVSSATEVNATVQNLALVLPGGGARAAYQVGVLRFLAREFPQINFPILIGVSAGAINTAMLASYSGGFEQATEKLAELWGHLHMDEVFRTDAWDLAGNALRWGVQLITAGKHVAPPIRGMVNTSPLREFLFNALSTKDGTLPGIEKNLRSGKLQAVGITTTNYGTGQSITWVQGKNPEMWCRPQRISIETKIHVDHVMASASLPLFFPAVQIGTHWHGDGGIRLTTPLSPALHLGAEKILAIATRYGRTQSEADSPTVEGYPPPAQILGVLMNAIFLDVIEADAMNMARLNQLLGEIPPEKRKFRKVELLTLRPSQDIGKLAARFEFRLPRSFRFLTRGLGTKETSSPDFLAMLMFHPDYLSCLIELGERDAKAKAEEIRKFVTT